LAAKIPAAAAEIVLRAMAKQPADRYESMEAMESALWQLELQQTGGVTALGRLTDTRSRRFLIVLMGGLILLALIGIGQFFSGGWSDRGGTFLPQGEPIRVGVLHSLSGTMADSERPVVHAVLLAIEELNNAGGVLGRPVEAIVADGKSRADVFAAEAERLINQQQVVTVFGCWTSESRKTIVPLFEEADHLLIYPVQYEGLEESPNVFYLGAAPNQQILPAIDWLHRVLEARKFVIVGSDYVFPRVASEIIKDRLQELGGELVGEVYLPLGSRNVDLAVETIEQTQPDVILNLINGSTNVALFSELRKRGIMPDKIPAISFSVGEAELARMDATAMVGDYAAWNYFQSIDSAENKEFVRKFRAKYGPHQVVTDPMETAYAGVKLWAAAVEDADSTAPGAIRRALKNMRGHAPGGPVRIDPGTQHAFKRPRIGRVAADGQFEIVWEAEKPLRPEPYPDSRSAAEWRAVLHDLYRDWGNRWSPPWEAGRPAAGKK
jgi:urea transport system substrate-binding protein